MKLLKTLFLLAIFTTSAIAQTTDEKARTTNAIHKIISENIAADGRILMSNAPDLTKRITNRLSYWENKKGRRKPGYLDYGKNHGDGFAYNNLSASPPLLLYGFGADDIEFWTSAYHIDAETKKTDIEDEGKKKIENEVNYFSFGFDRSLNQSIVFGMYGMYEKSKTDPRQIMYDGDIHDVNWQRQGWLLTPYLVGQSNSGGLFEMALSYGKSKASLQSTSEDLEAEKFIASLKLARDIYADTIIFTPKIQYIYFSDEQEKHNISFGETGTDIAIEFSETTINRINFGLGFTQEFIAQDKSVLATALNLNLFYDHIKSTIAALPEKENLTARAEVSLDYQKARGINWNISTHYDIYNEANDIKSYGGKAGINFRF